MPRIPGYEPSVQLTHLGPGIEQDSNSFGVEARALGKSQAEMDLVSAPGQGGR